MIKRHMGGGQGEFSYLTTVSLSTKLKRLLVPGLKNNNQNNSTVFFHVK